MISHGKEVKVFAGNSNPALAKAVCDKLSKRLGDCTVSAFADGEVSLTLGEPVRRSDVFIVQSTCKPVNDNLMELLIMVDAMKRASASRINAVIPYYGYARQDRKAKSRDPITAKLTADLLSVAGVDRVITMDLHAAQIQGYFDIPVDHLMGIPLLAKYFKELIKNGTIDNDVVVVSPDLGSVSRVRSLSGILECPVAIVDKRRPKPNVSEIMNIIGDIGGKTAILVDDMIDTAGTITNAANAIKKLGAKEVYACATHPVLSGPAIQRIQDSEIKQLVLLNTIPLSPEKKIDKMKILSVAPLFAETMMRVFNNESVSNLFD